MTKLYIKRNINELAELSFRNKNATVLSPEVSYATFLGCLESISGKKFLVRDAIGITEEEKTFIGEFTRKQIEDALSCISVDYYEIAKVEQHLELIDD